MLEKRKYFVEFDGNKFEKWVQCTDKKKYSVEVHQEVAVGSDVLDTKNNIYCTTLECQKLYPATTLLKSNSNWFTWEAIGYHYKCKTGLDVFQKGAKRRYPSYNRAELNTIFVRINKPINKTEI